MNFQDMTYEQLFDLSKQIEELLKVKRKEVIERMKASGFRIEDFLDTPKPKYRNPENPEETYRGKGPKPRWLKEKLEAGRSLEEFEV